MLVRVVAPHFVAGAEFTEEGKLLRAAPILWRAHTLGRLKDRARRGGWQIEEIEEDVDGATG